MGGEIGDTEQAKSDVFNFSIWHIGSKGEVRWIASDVKTRTTTQALRRKCVDRDNYPVGMYLVCDPTYNPNEGESYGPSLLWLYRDLSIGMAVAVINTGTGGDVQIETEMIEI